MGRRVVESVADDFEVDVVGEGDGGPGVAKAVDGEAGEQCLWVGLVVLVLFAEELAAESFGVIAAAVFEAEDVVVVVVDGPEHGLLIILDQSPFGEQGDGGWVEVEDVASASLMAVLEDDVVVVVGGELVEHGGGAAVEVDVGPAQAEDFAAAGAAGGAERPGVAVAAVAEPCEEALEVVGGPGLAGELVDLAGLGDGGCFGDVAVDAVPAQRVGEGFGDDAVDHADGSRRQVSLGVWGVASVLALATDGAGDGMAGDALGAGVALGSQDFDDVGSAGALVVELERAGEGDGRVEAGGGRRELLGVEELGVELVEVGRGELLESGGADVGDDVETDLLFVASPGGRFEIGAAGGEPFVGEVVGDGDAVGVDVVAVAEVGEMFDAIGFSFGDGAKATAADLATFAVSAGDVGEPGVGVAASADVGFAGLAAVVMGCSPLRDGRSLV